jgi:hypothetical protein
METAKLTLRISEELRRKLVALARGLDRSLNGAAIAALKAGIIDLMPPQEHVRPLAQLARPRREVTNFHEHLSPSGPCNCSVGVEGNKSEAKGGL